MDNKDGGCWDCAYFKLGLPKNPGDGYCRRYPPVFIRESYRVNLENALGNDTYDKHQYALEESWEFPPVSAEYHWCGEFKPASAEEMGRRNSMWKDE